jgi:luciferase family oxidoreductase group 1
LTELLEHGYQMDGQPVIARPVPPEPPQLWMLGTNQKSASYAAEFGTGYVFGQFMSDGDGQEIIAQYRRGFKPSQLTPEPRVIVAVSVICADTEAEARQLAAASAAWFMPQGSEERATDGLRESSAALSTAAADAQKQEQSQRGQPVQAPHPSAEQAAAFPRRRTVTGTPKQVRDQLEELSRRCSADELLIVSGVPDYAKRLRSYELLAQAVAENGD